MYELLRAKTRSMELKPCKLRKEGILPAVMFGEGKKSVPLQLYEKNLRRCLAKGGQVFEVEIDENERHLVSLFSIQKQPGTGKLLHVSLHKLKKGRKTTLVIPLHLEGECQGVKEGGIVVHQMREVEVTGLPENIPEMVKVNISDLYLGQTLYLKDIPCPVGITFNEHHFDHVVVNCHVPKIVTETKVSEEETSEEDAGTGDEEGKKEGDKEKAAEKSSS